MTPPRFSLGVHPKTIDLLAREQFEQRTPAWYERRKHLMTASDAPAALGVKPYASYAGDPRADCLRKKVSGSFRGSIHTAHGIRLEDTARDLAAQVLGITIFDVGLLVHKDLPWLGASPDGITSCGKCVEIKVCFVSHACSAQTGGQHVRVSLQCPMQRDIVPGKIPAHYFPQVQVQMEVCDLDATVWIEYKPKELTETGQYFLAIHMIERDRDWFARHKDALHDFFVDYRALRERTPPQAPSDLPACTIVDALYDEYSLL